MSDTILVELKGYKHSLSALETLRFGQDGYSDPSAAGYYDPRLVEEGQALSFRRDMFAGNATGGPTRINAGFIRLANDDGALDSLRTDYGLAGQEAVILIGDAEGAYGGFSKLITGRVQMALFSFRDLRVELYDRLQDLQQPVQQTKFAGSNSLPNGLEGVDDLKGKPKPLAYGDVRNASPPCVNTSRLIWQVNDGAVSDVPAVYDAGASLTKGADYSSQSDMETNAPSAGQYRVWKTGGYFRLGSTPVGTVTCDILEGANAAARSAAQIAQRIVTRTGGIASGDVESADVTALDAANAAVLGIWIADEAQFGGVLDPILQSPGAWYGFDRQGKFRMQRVQLPGASPAATFKQFKLGVEAATTDYDIIDCRFVPTNDPDRGLPAYEVSLEYNRNWTVQQGDGLAGSVTTERKNFLKEATRTVTASDATVKTANPLALQKKAATLFVNQSAAQAEADRRLVLYKTQRDFIEIDTPMVSGLVSAIDLGSTVQVVIPRFGYASGKNMLVVGLGYSAIGRKMTLALWG